MPLISAHLSPTSAGIGDWGQLGEDEREGECTLYRIVCSRVTPGLAITSISLQQ